MRYALALLLIFTSGCSIADYFRLKKDQDLDFSKTGNEIFSVKVGCDNTRIRLLIQTSSSRPEKLNVSKLIKSDYNIQVEKYIHFDRSSTNWPKEVTVDPKTDSIVNIQRGDILEIIFHKKASHNYSFQLQEPFVNNPTMNCVKR